MLWFIPVSDSPRPAAAPGSVPDPWKMERIFLSRYAARDKEGDVLFYDEVRIFTKEPVTSVFPNSKVIGSPLFL